MAKKSDKSGIFIDNYVKCSGNVSEACKATGINRDTYYEWMKDDKFKTQIKLADTERLEQYKDRAEAVVWKLIEGFEIEQTKVLYTENGPINHTYKKRVPPNLKAALAWLEHHARDWGWGEQAGAITAAQVNMLTNVVLRSNKLGPESSRQLLLGIGIDPPVVENIIGTITNTQDTGLINIDHTKTALYNKLIERGIAASEIPDILSILDTGSQWGADMLNNQKVA